MSLPIHMDEVCKACLCPVCSCAHVPLSPDDESAFRQRIVGLADAFSDMVTFTFKEIAEAIRQDACHILLDMQVHTRSTWCEGC